MLNQALFIFFDSDHFVLIMNQRNISFIMSMPVDHIEVAPRMWDKRLAANIIETNEPTVVDQTDTNNVAQRAITAGASFFTRFKSVIIPVAFVLCVIIV